MSVIGITDIIRQSLVDVIVLAYVVIGMDEVGVLGTHTSGKINGIAYELVGVMWRIPASFMA